MKIIRNSLIPRRGFAAMNLFGLLFVRKGVILDPVILNHERIHTRQQLELLFLPFLLVYLGEWQFRWLTNGFNGLKAYRSISFEREAYDHQNDLTYLSRRRIFGQWRKNQ